MKTCACCGAVAPASEPTCTQCGEASWYESPEDRQAAPPVVEPRKKR